MTIESSRSDARTNVEQAGRWSEPRRVPSFGRALAGITLCAMAFCAQGAIDSSISTARRSLPPAPLSTSPALIELSDSTPTVLVTLHNDDNLKTMVVHVQPMIWSQDRIAPHYESTSDVIAQPATFEVAPGATQIVQVELRSPAHSVRGQNFQLIWEAQAAPPDAAYGSDERAAP